MNVRAHHRAQAPGAGAGRGARLLHRGQKALERALLAKEQDLVLAAEVVVQVAGRKIGFLGDLAHAGRRETQAAEYARGRAQDLQAPRVVLALDALRQGALVRTPIQNLNHCSNSKPQKGPKQSDLMLRCGGTGYPRSLKRWILPVAVLGNSFTNSIQRGYL